MSPVKSPYDEMIIARGDLEDLRKRVVDAENKVKALSDQSAELKEVTSMSLAEVVAEIDGIISFDDQAYRVRDRALGKQKIDVFNDKVVGFCSPWNLPEVIRYHELCRRMRELLKEEGVAK